MRRFFPLIVSCAALLSGCATQVNPVTGENERTVMDEPSEIAEGKKAHEQVLQEYGALRRTRSCRPT